MPFIPCSNKAMSSTKSGSLGMSRIIVASRKFYFHKQKGHKTRGLQRWWWWFSYPWLDCEYVWQFYAADHLGIEVFVEHLYDKNGHKGDATVHKDLPTLLVTGSSIICVSYVSFLWQLHNNAKLAVIRSWFCLPNGLQDVNKKFQFSHFLGIQHSCMNLVNPYGFSFLRSLIVCFTSTAVVDSVMMVVVSKHMSAIVWLPVWCWIVWCWVLVYYFSWDVKRF